MSFFLNPFSDEFEGIWVLGDRQHCPSFIVKGNSGRGHETVTSWNKAPYNLSGNDADGNARNILKIAFCLFDTKNWATLSIDVSATAASAAATLPEEVASALNANTLFAERFTASADSYNDPLGRRVIIKQKKPQIEFKFYILSGQAEEAIGFNVRAGVGELPTFFAKHTIANRFTYADSQGMLIQLAPGSSTVDANIINNAVDHKGISLGYSSATVLADWQLLKGRSGIFEFTSGPGAGPVSTTETVIVYPAGAKKGDLARKTITQKNGASAIIAVYQLPYVLDTADLVTPP